MMTDHATDDELHLDRFAPGGFLVMTPAQRAATLHCFLVLNTRDNLNALRFGAIRLHHLVVPSHIVGRDAPLSAVERNLQEEVSLMLHLIEAVEAGAQGQLCALLRKSRTSAAVTRAHMIAASLGGMHDTYLATGEADNELLHEGCVRYEVAAYSLRYIADAVRTASKALKELDE